MPKLKLRRNSLSINSLGINSLGINSLGINQRKNIHLEILRF